MKQRAIPINVRDRKLPELIKTGEASHRFVKFVHDLARGSKTVKKPPASTIRDGTPSLSMYPNPKLSKVVMVRILLPVAPKLK